MNYPIPHSRLNTSFLEKVESGEIAEDVTIEFKVQEYDLSHRDNKKGLLRDISAMINMKGGVIVLGASDDGELVGIAIDDLDQYKRQVLQTINTGIEPQVTGIDFKLIDHDDKKFLCILVPSPSNKPYCYKIPQSEAREFLIRNNGINHHLSMSEIRRMFIGQSAIDLYPWSKWKVAKISEIKNNKWLKPLMDTKCTLVIVHPKDSSPSDTLIDTLKLKSLSERNAYIWPPHSNGCTRVPFENGLFALGRPKGDFGQDEACYSFVVAENNSAMYFYDGMPPFSRDSSNRIDPSIDKSVFDYVERADEFLKLAGFNGHKYEISLTLLNAKHYKIVRDSFMYAFPGSLSTAVGIPNEIFELTVDFRIGDDIKKALKPIFDKLWQTSGFDRCFHYSEKGEYTQHQ